MSFLEEKEFPHLWLTSRSKDHAVDRVKTCISFKIFLSMLILRCACGMVKCYIIHLDPLCYGTVNI
uniref:Uncharacterized protein n=1 Tax=Nelumbo nucifera TaxID=4432 RepID=A0A822Y465_NELNU|nr:TPA_asm: hypothetical protein HUJ06_028251 [Nelumbo nucifera]